MLERKKHNFQFLGIEQSSNVMINARFHLVDPKIFLSWFDSIVYYYFTKQGYQQEKDISTSIVNAALLVKRVLKYNSECKTTWKFCYEILENLIGACVDFSILLANILLTFKILPEEDIFVVKTPTHSFCMVYLENTYYKIDILSGEILVPVNDDIELIFNIFETFSNYPIIIMKEA